jgi:dihydrodipicolinate synthase/N-acetylneuraminate lyase
MISRSVETLAAAGNDAERNSSSLASLCRRSGYSAIVAAPESMNGPADYPA